MGTKFKIIIFLGLFTFIGISSCGINGGENEDLEKEVVNMRVNHFKQTAFGAFPQLVLLTQETAARGGEEWSFFYNEIEGFEYEKAYIYELSVRKEPVENPMQDESAVKYILQDVISKERIDINETFEIKLKWADHNFVNNSEDQYFLMDQYEIDCSELCEDLSLKLGNQNEVTGIFSHGENNSLKLISLQ